MPSLAIEWAHLFCELYAKSFFFLSQNPFVGVDDTEGRGGCGDAGGGAEVEGDSQVDGCNDTGGDACQGGNSQDGCNDAGDDDYSSVAGDGPGNVGGSGGVNATENTPEGMY